MYVLDTDHWTVLQLRTGPEYERLILRMDKVGRRNCFTTIVTFHEVMNGWLKYISSPKSQQSVVFAYTRFEELLRAFANSDLLPFSEKSADEFDRQRGLGCRIGTSRSIDRNLAWHDSSNSQYSGLRKSFWPGVSGLDVRVVVFIRHIPSLLLASRSAKLV